MARSWTADERRRALSEGHALPPLHEGGEPRYPIEDCEDVSAAIHDLGRTQASNRAEVRAHIVRRATALGCDLPDTWKVRPT